MNAPVANLAGLDLRAEIDRLRKERNAVILAHYYQVPEIQDLADFVGDSLDLSRKAAETDAEVIAFCGVRFMAEVAKILSPDKTVVLPDMAAGCSLEDSCPPEQFARFRAAHPDHIAITYINCSAAVKAHSDIIVTSSSAEKILAQIADGPENHFRALTRIWARTSTVSPGATCCCGRARASCTRRFQRDRTAEAQGAISGRAGRRASRMPRLHPRSCRSGRLDAGDPRIRSVFAGADDHRRDRAAHHPPDGESGTAQDLHRRARRRRELQLQYVPVYGDELASRSSISRCAILTPRIEMDEALRIAAKRPLDRMLEMASGTVGKGDLGGRVTGD